MDPSDTIVKLRVKDKEAPINVHRGLLCKSSKFLQRAMKPEWANSREDPDTVDLSDELSESVSLYVRWLYSGELLVNMPVFREGKDEENRISRKQAYSKLATAYVFGGKVMDVCFKNAVITKFMKTKTAMRIVPDSGAVAKLYSSTTDGAPMRHLIADMIACACAPSVQEWTVYLRTLNHEAVFDIMLAMADLRKTPAQPKYLSKPELYLEDES